MVVGSPTSERTDLSDIFRKARMYLPFVGRAYRVRNEALKAKARAIRARDGADRSKARADQARKRPVEILRQIEDANTSLAVKLAERSQELDVLRKETRLLRLERDGLLSELAMLRTELDAPSQPTAKTSADREPAATERGGATAAAGKRRENGHARAPTA